MEMVAPLGPVYQAGTLSGNPLAMRAGIETLKVLGEPGIYSRLEAKSSVLEKGIAAAADEAKLALCLRRVGTMFTAFFSGESVADYEAAKRANTELYGRFFQQMLAQGIYWPPSQFEAAFVSAVHSDEDIRTTIKAVERALGSVASARQLS